jgi:hypothetical protein
MKELFLSSLMQWMATPGRIPMGEIIPAQAAQIRAQMSGSPHSGRSLSIKTPVKIPEYRRLIEGVFSKITDWARRV